MRLPNRPFTNRNILIIHKQTAKKKTRSWDIFPRVTLGRQEPTRTCGFLWSSRSHADYRRPLLSVPSLSIITPTKTSTIIITTETSSVQRLWYPERALTSLALSSSTFTSRRQHLWYAAVTLRGFCCLSDPFTSFQKSTFLYSPCKHWVMAVPVVSRHPSKYPGSLLRHTRDRHIITSVNILQARE